MDTTPQYKKQCIGAFGDIGFVFSGIDVLPNLLIVDDNEPLVSWAASEKMIQEYHGGMFKIHGQLYRQDQLLGLVYHKLASPVDIVWDLNDWHTEDTANYIQQFKSMEQFCLARVMIDKYSKTWDGNKWVKEG